jgi:hypothetical protein
MAERAVPVEPESYAGGVDATRSRRTKITVRLSPERMERARKAVAWGYAPSISAWVEEAVRKHDSSFGWCETLEESFDAWLREVGPLSEEELACARAKLAELQAI